MATRRRKKAAKKRGVSGRTFAEGKYVSRGNSRYDRHDPLFRRAREEGYLARSIYKLEEIDNSFRLLRPGDNIIDLGSAPGSWLQYVEKEARQNGGLVVGIDLLEVRMSFGEHVHILRGDIYETTLEELRHPNMDDDARFDVVLSDMAPNTTGVRQVDQARSASLAERALEVGQRALAPGGNTCIKVLEGRDFHFVIERAKKLFDTVKIRRPKGTRAGSTETYLIGLGLKEDATEL